jgi:phosphate transport system permease protein
MPDVVMTTDNIRTKKLPVVADLVIAVAALVVAFAIVLGTGIGDWVLAVVVGVVLYLVGLNVAASRVEGRRAARNRMWRAAIYLACLLAVIPLASVAWTLVSKGASRLDGDFFNASMNNIGARDAGGGAYHAIIGTLEQVGIATIIAVPLGVLAAIYIVEYGRGKLTAAIRFFVDVMTGVPSIVFGLFIYTTLVVSGAGGSSFAGWKGGLALALLMLPVVTRSAEVVLQLVPQGLREAALALGAPRWRVTLSVVVRTAIPGLITGSLLAVARAMGETAPLLFTVGALNATSLNLNDQMNSLPLQIFRDVGQANDQLVTRAWGSALTLVVMILILTLVARAVGRRSAKS